MPDKDISLAEQLTCAEREVRLRCKTYPRWVHARKMEPLHAEQEIARMRAIVQTLRGLVEGQQESLFLDVPFRMPTRLSKS